jgi:ABC-2 type transport system permease protein
MTAALAGSRYVGTASLARLIMRRDRVRLTIWVYVIVGLVASTVYSLKGLYPTVAARVAFGETIRANPTLLAVTGRVFDATTIGGLTAWRVGGLATVAAAIMSVLTVVRHTRAEEEAGRTELVSAGVVGRRAPLFAALAVVASINLTAGALIVLVTVTSGAGLAGALAFGAALAAGGITFAAVAAVAAQLPDSSRTASGLAFATLGVTFLLRAVGDSTDGGTLAFLSWLSPIGWAQQVRPYAAERWWVFALFAALIAALIAGAYALVGRRDVGAGLRATQLGPAAGAPSLRSPLALAWRLHRGSLYGWSTGQLVAGAFVGGAAKNVDSLVKTSPQLEDIIRRLGGSSGLTDVYLASTFGLMGLVVSAYAVQATLRARAEETALRAESVLATTASRARFLASHVTFALLGSAVLLIATGLGAGLSYGAATHDLGQVPRLIGATLGLWPAVAVLAGIAVGLFGVRPGQSTLAWAALGLFALLGQLGPVLRLPQAVMDVSPYAHVPKLPGGDVRSTPFLVLAAVAAVLIGVGFGAFRRRDIG